MAIETFDVTWTDGAKQLNGGTYVCPDNGGNFDPNGIGRGERLKVEASARPQVDPLLNHEVELGDGRDFVDLRHSRGGMIDASDVAQLGYVSPWDVAGDIRQQFGMDPDLMRIFEGLDGPVDLNLDDANGSDLTLGVLAGPKINFRTFNS